jgi:hypothetical protein
MYQDEKNEYGCPLHYQSGRIAVRDFQAVVERLSPGLRAAFETERAARLVELAFILATCASTNTTPPGNRASYVEQAPEPLMQPMWFKRLLKKIGQQFTIYELIGAQL